MNSIDKPKHTRSLSTVLLQQSCCTDGRSSKEQTKLSNNQQYLFFVDLFSCIQFIYLLTKKRKRKKEKEKKRDKVRQSQSDKVKQTKSNIQTSLNKPINPNTYFLHKSSSLVAQKQQLQAAQSIQDEQLLYDVLHRLVLLSKRFGVGFEGVPRTRDNRALNRAPLKGSIKRDFQDFSGFVGSRSVF